MNSSTPELPTHNGSRYRFYAAYMTLGIGVLLFIIKLTAWKLTGSMAILSDALENIINIIAGIGLLASLIISSRPADQNHPYGQGKIEYLMVGLEGTFIILTAGLILYEAIPGIIHPPNLEKVGGGLALVALSGAINYILGMYLIHSGRKYHSPALVADGHHVQTDGWTGIGIIAGVGLASLTGIHRLDPILACAVAIHILFTGYTLIKSSINSLLDKVDPEQLTILLEALEKLRTKDMIYPHRLRFRPYGHRLYIDYHLTLPRYWELAKADGFAHQMENNLLMNLGRDGDVVIHTDPCVDECCSYCQIGDCPIRKEIFTAPLPWDYPTLSSEAAYLKPE